MDKIKIKSAIFQSIEFYYQYKIEFDLLKGKKWVLAPVIPPGFTANLLDPNAIFTKLPSIKTPNYDPAPIGVYSTGQERHRSVGCYDAVPHGPYELPSIRTVQRDKVERESRIK